MFHQPEGSFDSRIVIVPEAHRLSKMHIIVDRRLGIDYIFFIHARLKLIDLL